MDKSDLIKYGIVAVGAYFLYTMYMKPATTTTTGGGGTTPATTTPATNPPVNTTTPPAQAPNVPVDIAARMNVAAGGDAAMNTQKSLNTDQWSYYWQQISGRQLSAQEFGQVQDKLREYLGSFPYDGNTLISSTAFANAAKAAGMTGLGGGFGGLGNLFSGSRLAAPGNAWLM